ncbi:MAG: 2-dehydropantoate 2-reductase N-terminal domain-containing protein, partial [Candidatus Eisenbacteria bacterium]
MSRVAVLGAGSFGTTLAVHLAQAGHDTRLWGRDAAAMARLARERENAKFLAGITLPAEVKVHAELEVALRQAEFVLFVVPSQAMRSVAEQVAATGARGVPVCASKGLELGTLRRLSQVLTETLGDPAPVTLTGPSHAEEVARGIPTTVVAARNVMAKDAASQRSRLLTCVGPTANTN